MKKKIFLLAMTAFVCMFTFNSHVFAKDITCPGLSDDVIIDGSIPDIVSLIIRVIQIVVPIILVVMGSIDLIKGVVAQKEDEIKKGQQIFIKRLIAGVLVFFVIAIVKFVISAMPSGSDAMDCACYFFNGSDSASCN